jgi:hypothetical protein
MSSDKSVTYVPAWTPTLSAPVKGRPKPLPAVAARKKRLRAHDVLITFFRSLFKLAALLFRAVTAGSGPTFSAAFQQPLEQEAVLTLHAP